MSWTPGYLFKYSRQKQIKCPVISAKFCCGEILLTRNTVKKILRKTNKLILSQNYKNFNAENREYTEREKNSKKQSARPKNRVVREEIVFLAWHYFWELIKKQTVS